MFIYIQTISIEEVQKRMKKMNAVKRSADKGIQLLKNEEKRRKQSLQE